MPGSQWQEGGAVPSFFCIRTGKFERYDEAVGMHC